MEAPRLQAPPTVRLGGHCRRGVAKKTELLLCRELLEGFGYPVLRQPFVIVEVMGYDEVSVRVAHERSVIAAHIDLLARVIDAFHLLRGEEDIVVLHLRT